MSVKDSVDDEKPVTAPVEESTSGEDGEGKQGWVPGEELGGGRKKEGMWSVPDDEWEDREDVDEANWVPSAELEQIKFFQKHAGPRDDIQCPFSIPPGGRNGRNSGRFSRCHGVPGGSCGVLRPSYFRSEAPLMCVCVCASVFSVFARPVHWFQCVLAHFGVLVCSGASRRVLVCSGMFFWC